MLSLRGRCFDVITWRELCTWWIFTVGWFGSYVPGTASSNSLHISNFGETYCSSSDVSWQDSHVISHVIKLGDIQLNMITCMHACVHTCIHTHTHKHGHAHTCNCVSNPSLFRHNTIIHNKFYKKHSKAYPGQLSCADVAQSLWDSYVTRKWLKAYLGQLR